MKLAPIFLSLTIAAGAILPANAQETQEGQSFSERCDSDCIDGHVDRIMNGISGLIETTPLDETLPLEIPTDRVFQGCPEVFNSHGIPLEELPGVSESDYGDWADLLAQRLEWQCPGDGEGNPNDQSGPIPTS